MISGISKMKSEFLKYTAYRIYVEKTRLITLCVCGVLGLPLFGIASSLVTNGNASQSVGMFLGISCITLFVSTFVMATICYSGGMNNFDYYIKREKIDLSWSLPVRNRNRFWGILRRGSHRSQRCIF
ncbi:MAG: hypothetical protein FWG83_05915 [Oscillospiraceae bacterium]|nr:hypothetical protein [Oscillospiraceae bacterium]